MIRLTAKYISTPANAEGVKMDGDEPVQVSPDHIAWTYEMDTGGTVLVMETGDHIHVTASPQRIKEATQSHV